ncbi:unnamed protein product [Echinostoma caproni]|uniref:Protein CHUP1, chloroplastic n=1 Tax=Echinostoma caproni TaxID=27848 RepID=A0A183APJ4_9TREM|nr:unnamed protein product [Echinostoma caproni]
MLKAALALKGEDNRAKPEKAATFKPSPGRGSAVKTMGKQILVDKSEAKNPLKAENPVEKLGVQSNCREMSCIIKQLERELQLLKKDGKVAVERNKNSLLHNYGASYRHHEGEGSMDQLLEAWEEEDGMTPDSFEPRSFFLMHGNYSFPKSTKYNPPIRSNHRELINGAHRRKSVYDNQCEHFRSEASKLLDTLDGTNKERYRRDINRKPSENPNETKQKA